MNLETRVINNTEFRRELFMKVKHVASNDFGQRLKSLRQARGLSQDSLATRCGISQRMVAHYETRSKFPRINILPLLAKALKVSTEELIGLKKFKDEDLIKNKNLVRRFMRVAKFPLRDQRAVFQLINALEAQQQLRQSKNNSHK